MHGAYPRQEDRAQLEIDAMEHQPEYTDALYDFGTSIHMGIQQNKLMVIQSPSLSWEIPRRRLAWLSHYCDTISALRIESRLNLANEDFATRQTVLWRQREGAAEVVDIGY